MILDRINYSRALPKGLTVSQLLSVSKQIHGHVSKAVVPLLAAKPKYHAMLEVLDVTGRTIAQLEAVKSRQKVKSVTDMRSVGGLDGQYGPDRISARKRTAYNNRRTLMRQLRHAVSWHQIDMTLPDNQLDEQAAKDIQWLNKLIQKRQDHFEKLSYDEARSEFDLFIQSVEATSRLESLERLNLSNTFRRIKEQHALGIALHNEQTRLDALREKQPKFVESRRELRRAVSVLLNMLHFDIEMGDETLRDVLAQSDEIIDKARAVSKRRETIADQAGESALEKEVCQEEGHAASESSHSNDSRGASHSSHSSHSGGVASELQSATLNDECLKGLRDDRDDLDDLDGMDGRNDIKEMSADAFQASSEVGASLASQKAGIVAKEKCDSQYSRQIE